LKPRSKQNADTKAVPAVISRAKPNKTMKRKRSPTVEVRKVKVKRAKASVTSRRGQVPRAPNIDVDGTDEDLAADNQFNESGNDAANESDNEDNEEKSSVEEECDSLSLALLKEEVNESCLT
jgi:hypothetical protein